MKYHSPNDENHKQARIIGGIALTVIAILWAILTLWDATKEL